MAPPSLAHADRLAGGLIDRAMGAHHRRRLRNLGHASSYDPPADGRLWAAGDPPPRPPPARAPPPPAPPRGRAAAPPPRPGNALDVLVDGAQALPEIAAAIRGA